MSDYCTACGLPEPGSRFSLPTANGEVVANDYAGEWGGAPACRGCFEVHEAGGPRALEAHVRATKALRVQVLAYDAALNNARQRIDDTLRVAQAKAMMNCPFVFATSGLRCLLTEPHQIHEARNEDGTRLTSAGIIPPGFRAADLVPAHEDAR